MPGGSTERQPKVVLSGPNRVLNASGQPHQHHPFLHPEGCVLGVPAVADQKLASVSAYEHPDLTCAGRGLLAGFRRRVAP